MLTAAIADIAPKDNSYLRACLEQTGLVRSVAEWNISARESPLAAGMVPDVVLIDLVSDPEACFAFAAQVRRMRPSTCLLACSAIERPSPELLMQAMRSGLQEFLKQPVDMGALREVLERYMYERGPSVGPSAIQKLIVVMGSKGGVGTSTIAVNLGVQLAGLTQKRVVLLDFGRPVGHDSLMLNLQPEFSIRNAIENLERLDSHFFAGLLTRHKSGLGVLAGTSDLDAWQHIPVPALARVVNVAQGSCDHLLMDLGSMYSSEWSAVLRLAQTIVLVAQADVPGLWTLERHITAMVSFGLDPGRLRIIINRWHRSDEEALGAFEKMAKRPVFARLPNDFRQVSQAANLGAPLSKNHNDPLTTKFRQIATQIAGIAPAAGEKRGALFNLFSAGSKR